MIKSIIMGEYCLRFFEKLYTVTDSNGKLVFYYNMLHPEDDMSDGFWHAPLYPYSVSYDPDLIEDSEMISYIVNIISATEFYEEAQYFVKLFCLVKEQENFKYYLPGDYISNTNGNINIVELRHYLIRFKSLSDNPSIRLFQDEPYSLFCHKFEFHQLCAHISNKPFNEQFQEISRNRFEFFIPNEKIGSAYISIYDENNKFFMSNNTESKMDVGFIAKTNDEIKLLFEIDKNKK